MYWKASSHQSFGTGMGSVGRGEERDIDMAPEMIFFIFNEICVQTKNVVYLKANNFLKINIFFLFVGNMCFNPSCLSLILD